MSRRKQRPGPAPAPAAPPALPVAWVVVLVLGALLVGYHNSFRVPFVFDDRVSIVENESIRSLTTGFCAPRASGATVAGRPLLNFSFALNHAVGGLDPRGYHAVNLALHAGAALLLFGLVRRTLASESLRPAWGTHASWVAAAVALLWAVHPLQTESVTYVVQRAESLVGVLYLLTLYAVARSAGSARPWRWQMVAVLACLLGMAGKEVMATAPLLALLYDRTFLAGTFREALARRGRMHAALFASLFLLGWLVWSTGSRGGTVGFSSGISPWHYLLTQCHAVLLYLKLSVWPDPLVLDYGVVVVREPGQAWLQALALLTLAGATLWALVRRPVPGFLGAWFFVILGPSSSLMPVATQTIAEHRMYLPLAAVMGGLVLAGHALLRRHLTLFAGATLAIAVVFTALTVRRNRDYRTQEAIWSDVIAKRPQNGRAHGALGNFEQQAGRPAAAIPFYEKAVTFGPPNGSVHGSLATALMETGRLPEAIEQFRIALELVPDDARAHNNLGNALLASGDIPGALEHLRRAIGLDPTLSDARFNLANALTSLGRLAEAVPAYEAAIVQKPDFFEARFNLGNTLAMLGRVDEAIAMFQRCVELRPDLPDAWCNLGHALAQSGRRAGAEANYREALRRDPTHAGALEGLARLQASPPR